MELVRSPSGPDGSSSLFEAISHLKKEAFSSQISLLHTRKHVYSEFQAMETSEHKQGQGRIGQMRDCINKGIKDA